jgi:UDP-glucose 4-epimerase
VALRYFNVYGPRMDVHGRYTEVMIRWMERLDAGMPPVIFGDGSQTIDLVHVQDVGWANLLAAVAPPQGARALNVGSGRETSLLELAAMLAAAMGRPDLQPVREPERAVNSVRRRLADTSAARAAIGFEALTPPEEGVRGLVAWWRGQPAPARRAAE